MAETFLHFNSWSDAACWDSPETLKFASIRRLAECIRQALLERSILCGRALPGLYLDLSSDTDLQRSYPDILRFCIGAEDAVRLLAEDFAMQSEDASFHHLRFSSPYLTDSLTIERSDLQSGNWSVSYEKQDRQAELVFGFQESKLNLSFRLNSELPLSPGLVLSLSCDAWNWNDLYAGEELSPHERLQELSLWFYKMKRIISRLRYPVVRNAVFRLSLYQNGEKKRIKKTWNAEDWSIEYSPDFSASGNDSTESGLDTPSSLWQRADWIEDATSEAFYAGAFAARSNASSLNPLNRSSFEYERHLKHFRIHHNSTPAFMKLPLALRFEAERGISISNAADYLNCDGPEHQVLSLINASLENQAELSCSTEKINAPPLPGSPENDGTFAWILRNYTFACSASLPLCDSAGLKFI